jgi:hypothetical protein
MEVYQGPRNLTEFLFADEGGEVPDQVNVKEMNAVYMSYLQSLV